MIGLVERAVSRVAFAIRVLVLPLLLSCGGGGGDSASPGGWKMVLNHNGASVVIPLHSIDVYLVEDESYPEYFSIESEGVLLGGTFPVGMHVGYQEDWKQLFGKAIVVGTNGGDPTDPQESFIELSSGVRSRVMGGTLTFDKLSGKTPGRDGDLTLSGRVMLVVQTGGALGNVMGTISVHCVTWG
jgi:hypothetical protein